MSAVAGLILFLIEQALKYGYEYPVKIFKIFHDILGELSFGAFISWSAENVSYLESYLNAHEKALLTFTYYCDPIMLFNFGFDTIIQDRDIIRWITKYKYLNQAFTKVYILREENKFTSDVLQFLNTVLQVSPFAWIIKIMEDILSNPMRYYDEFSGALYNFWTESKGDIKSFLDKVNKYFEEAPHPDIELLLEPSLFHKINPILHYQWVTWLSHLKLHFAYKHALEQLKFPKIPPDFWQKLHARLYLDDKKVAWQRLGSDGQAVFRMSEDEFNKYNPYKVTIDIMGLQTSTTTSELIPYIEQNLYTHVKELPPEYSYLNGNFKPHYTYAYERDWCKKTVYPDYIEYGFEEWRYPEHPPKEYDDPVLRVRIIDDNTIRISVIEYSGETITDLYFKDTLLWQDMFGLPDPRFPEYVVIDLQGNIIESGKGE